MKQLDRINHLIVKYMRDAMSDTERKELDSWLDAGDDNRRIFEKVTSLGFFEENAGAYLGGERSLRTNWRRIENRILSSRRRLRRRRLAGYAAAMLIPVAAAAWLLLHDNGPGGEPVISRVYNDVTLTLPGGREIVLDLSTANSRIAEQGNIALVRENGRLIHEKQTDDAAGGEMQWGKVDIPRGTQLDLVLEDGTQVWLNAGSQLRFPIAFGGDERRVYLEGEGYFAVTRDAVKPFIVETAGQVLRVLGTEFNVYAYSRDNAIYTTLVTGSVLLTSKGSDAETVLEPGQQAKLLAGADSYDVATVDAQGVTSWRNGLFVFDNITLEEAFRKLARWYDFEYVFEDPAAAGLELMGGIPAYDELAPVLELIESSGLAVIEQKGNLVKIRMKK